MPDKGKIIKGLSYCTHTDGAECPNCPYWQDDDCVETLNADVLALLKEQESIPTVAVDTWICSKCGHVLEGQELIDDKENPQVLIHEQYQYCPECGRKVKWE